MYQVRRVHVALQGAFSHFHLHNNSACLVGHNQIGWLLLSRLFHNGKWENESSTRSIQAILLTNLVVALLFVLQNACRSKSHCRTQERFGYYWYTKVGGSVPQHKVG